MVEKNLQKQIDEFIKKDFKHKFGKTSDRFSSNPLWEQVRSLGTELWLDTGNIDEIEKNWTREFSAVTVNNTLLNNEIQSGRYDRLISEAGRIIEKDHSLDELEKILEMNYILNAVHGLKLVQKFDAYVSLEEHTELANDVDLAVDYARRLFALCPERFYIKIPLTAAGLLATRILSKEKIPVNHTLGFSARQNYMIARLANPSFVNVFLGRLNSFVADNKLGSGDYVGEKATLASQRKISELREKRLSTSQQIGASFRSGEQVRDLVGIDVMTMPPKAASEFLALDIDLNILTSRLETQYKARINQNVERDKVGLTSLWNIDEKLVDCLDDLEEENIDEFTPDDLMNFFEDYYCDDILVRWTDEQVNTSVKEGKIPQLSNWKDALESGKIGLDSLMNLAGLNHFRSDQDEMDKRVKKVWEDSRVYA